MRARWIFLVLAAAAVAVVARLNWAEFSRVSSVNLVWRTVEVPVALVLLGLLALAVVVGVASDAAPGGRHHHQTRAQIEGLQRALGSRLGEMEARLESRLERVLAALPDWPSNGPAAAATQQTGQAAPWAEPVGPAESPAECRDTRRAEARH